MKVSAAIMAHESRADRFEYLLKELGQDTPLFVDKGKLGTPGNLGPWRNAKRAWRAYDPRAEYHMVVQDDVVFCGDFMRRVQLIVKNSPQNAFCLFAKTGGPVIDNEFKKQLMRPRGGIIHSELYWALTVILPTEIINDMIIFGDNCTYDRGRGTTFDDDARISEYLKHIGMKVIYPLPSMVQHHRKYESLVGYGHNSKRQARWFI